MRSEDALSKSESEASAADPAAESAGGKQSAESPAAAAHADADDLASLGSGLPSLRPGDATEDAEADTLDLGRLVAAATRNVEGEPGGGKDSDRESAETAFSVNGVAPAVTAASLVPPRQRATWVVPMLVGVGLGVVIAGAAFGLAAGRPPPPADPPAAAAAPEVPASAIGATAEPDRHEEASQDQDRATAATNAAPATTQAAATNEVPADSALHAAGHPLANAHPVVAPRRPLNPEPAVEAPAPAPVPDDRTSLLKPKEPAAAPPAKTIEALAEAADPGANKDAEGETDAKGSSRVDQMLDEALAPDAQRAAQRQRQALAAAAAELPTAPSRDEVTKAMTVLLPAIRGCAMGQTGLMTAGIVVHNDGRVASVDITGAPFANTPSGRCMEGVMRRAQFPRFKQPIFRIKFPFAIQ